MKALMALSRLTDRWLPPSNAISRAPQRGSGGAAAHRTARPRERDKIIAVAQADRLGNQGCGADRRRKILRSI